MPGRCIVTHKAGSRRVIKASVCTWHTELVATIRIRPPTPSPAVGAMPAPMPATLLPV